MKVQILGTGCPNCLALEQRVLNVVRKNNLSIEIEKVTDIDDIISFGVMMTPGLVVDGQVKSVGKLPSEAKILEWLK